MKKNLIIQNNSKLDVNTKLIYFIYDKILKEENSKKDIVNLLFVDDKEMIAYNKKYRQIKLNTDVISFEDDLEYSPVLGDIIINLEQANRQKQNSLDDEVCILFIHGLLHLLGYDHIKSNEEKIMREKEKKYYSMIKGVK